MWYQTKSFLTQFAYSKKRGRLRRYSFPLLLALAVFTIAVYSENFYVSMVSKEVMAFLLLTLTVTLSSWFGGLGPGIFATVMTASSNYFIFAVTDKTPISEDLIVTAIFVIEGLIISTISEARYQSEQQKSDFIGFAAHELKNPLSVVKGYAQLALQHSGKTKDRKTLNYAREIQTQSDKLLGLINDLLDVTKIEVGEFVYKEGPFDLYDLIKETVDHQKMVAKSRKIRLMGKTRKLIFADRYRIGQVITNLLTNAIKYSPLGSEILVRVTGHRKSVTVSVKDHGMGLPQKELNKIFNQFYRTSTVQREKGNGLGLGLFICSRIVKHHHGKIWVKSRKHKGSTFFMELPIRQQAS